MPSQFFPWQRLAVAFACVLAASAVQADSFKMSTFNVAWLMDKPLFERWKGACQKSAGIDVEGLPYCNVHNGIKYEKVGKCADLAKEKLNRRPYQETGPCRESTDLYEWPLYERKLEALHAMVRELDDAGVTLIAFQEVSSTAALQQILPQGWSGHTSHDEPKRPNIPQHVGVAWKTGVHSPRGFSLVSDLTNVTDRPLRPGLVFSDKILGRDAQFLVVHLKSGCPGNRITPKTGSTQALSAECAILGQQAQILQQWIDDRDGKDFVVLGDFNRLLRDGSQPKSPQNPAKESVDQMFALLNGYKASGTKVVMARGQTCGPHPGIDNFLVSAELSRRVALGALSAQPLIRGEDGVAFERSTDQPVPAPSDHCAMWVALKRKS